jgi:hypothetical protein
MNFLPIRDEKPSLLMRAVTVALVPIVLVLAVPLLLLVVLLIYLAAMFHGVRVVVHVFTVKPETPDIRVGKPHFLKEQSEARALPEQPALDDGETA